MTEGGKADPLPTTRIEIRRIKPCFEGCPGILPLTVEDGEPGGIPISSVDYGSLPEDPFKGKSKPARRIF